MNFKTRNKVSAEFNLASLADVIFLLLIFFMLTSTLVAPNAIKLLLPSSSKQVIAKTTAEISITDDLRYYIGGRTIAFENLQAEILQVTNNIKDPSVVLRVDKSVPVEELVKVLDIGNKLKIKMILATKPLE